jgi:hypothetical protein
MLVLIHGSSAPGELHPISLAILQQYGLAMEFELVAWYKQAAPPDTKREIRAEMIRLATETLRHAAIELSKHGVLAYAPDPINFKLARTVIWLYQVSE